MELFTVILNGFQSLTIFVKKPIVTVRLGSKYASVIINLIFTSATMLRSKTNKIIEIFIVTLHSFSDISPET